jgi:uncharacterized CHY-type Zn-finger protein
MSRKPTIRELDEKINQTQENMGIMAGRIDQFLNMFVQELEKHNTLISKMLEQQGLMEESVCAECAGTIRIPMLDGLEPLEECPYCNASLNPDTTQTTLPLEEE